MLLWQIYTAHTTEDYNRIVTIELTKVNKKKNLELKLFKFLHEVPSHLKAILSLLMFLFRYSPLPKEEERKMKGYQLNSYKGIER